jgi:hypothetical protein
MHKKLIAHACRSIAPSGAFRASIGYAQEGRTCYHCGVVATKEIEIKFDTK